MNSRRQQKLSRLILKEMGDILQKEGLSTYGGAFITVTNVSLTPDFMIARVHLSIFNSEKKEEVLDHFINNSKELRFNLGNRLRHQLRRIPELEFYLDDTLDRSSKIDDLFRNLDKGDSENNGN